MDNVIILLHCERNDVGCVCLLGPLMRGWNMVIIAEKPNYYYYYIGPIIMLMQKSMTYPMGLAVEKSPNLIILYSVSFTWRLRIRRKHLRNQKIRR
jgi:hypothetical protein